MEILPVFDIQQAIDRTSDDEFNKGIEAAVAAIEMIAWRRGVVASN
jgi:6,7-dimethyl-8-ribityllumazine synthase